MPSWDIEEVARLCLDIQAIAAPTGAEHARARWVAERFHALGLHDVSIDEAPNVYGRVPGAIRSNGRASEAPAVMLSAHLDTVFPAEVDLSSRREGDRLFGPGIGDNCMGLAGLISLAERLVEVRPAMRDVWFVANAAEEGLGDLRGMRAAVERLGGRAGLHACIVLEGTSSGPWLVTHRALGSKRYRVGVQAPGGHSWGDFGAPSAIHELLRLAEPIARWSLPARPRASYNIGVITGGASVNTIAERAEMLLDLRSEDRETLAALARRAERAFERRASAAPRGVHVTWEVVGDRPAAGIPSDHPLVQTAMDALSGLGVPAGDIVRNVSSTDANVPLSQGIPAVTLYLTVGGDAHRESEWLSLERLPVGLRWAWDVVAEVADDDGSARD